jgi:hypothetical protein
MPSAYSNLNFHNRADIKRWKHQCAEQRRIALTWPAYDRGMLMVEEYGWKLGPWSLRLVLEIWQKPYFWHASAACFEQIAFETVTGPNGERFEVPQDALLKRDSWEPEHVEQADFILNEILGEFTRADDNSQQILIFDGLWARHMKLKFEGEETWKTKQH